jgi:predicted PurR-regulated permease PerM
MARPGDIPTRGSRFVVLASVCIVIAALYFAQEVLIPLALAVVLCFLLAPLVTRLERWRIGRAPAVVIVVSAAAAVVLALAWVVTAQILNLADRLPEYEVEIVNKVENFKSRFGGDGGITEKLEHVAKEIEEATTRPATQPETQATTTQSTTQSATQPATEAAATVPSPASKGRTDRRPPRDPAEQIMDDPPGAAARQIGADPPDEPPLIGTTKTNPLWVFAMPPPASPIRTLGYYLGVVLSPLGTAGLMLVFVIFILFQREDLRDRMIRLIGHRDLNVTTTALDDAATRISRYMLAQAIVNGTYGIAVAIGLWLIGYFVGGEPFPSFVLWALLCALLRFIPYIGPWVAAAFPITLSLAVYPGFEVFIWTAGMFVVIELLSNNLMEPFLYGHSTGMSTIAVLVSAVFWTWLWGAVGLLLATPLTVVLVVIGKYVPQLRFLDIMLGDEPVLEPHERVYQRLLAMDQEEAIEFAREYMKEMGLERVYDEVLNPALGMAEHDRHRGQLDEQRQEFIHQALREMIEELGDEWRLRQDRSDAAAMKAAAAATVAAAKGTETLESGAAVPERETPTRMPEAGASGTGNDGNGKPKHPAAAPKAPSEAESAVCVPKDCTVNVAILPAHDDADEISALMLAQILEFRGYCVFPMSVTTLASEMIEAVGTKQANVVVISAMPPAAVAHSRYLCKRLQARFSDLGTVVGLWAMKGDMKKATERVSCADNVLVAQSFGRGLELITQLAQPFILAADSPRSTEASSPEDAPARQSLTRPPTAAGG